MSIRIPANKKCRSERHFHHGQTLPDHSVQQMSTAHCWSCPLSLLCSCFANLLTLLRNQLCRGGSMLRVITNMHRSYNILVKTDTYSMYFSIKGVKDSSAGLLTHIKLHFRIVHHKAQAHFICSGFSTLKWNTVKPAWGKYIEWMVRGLAAVVSSRGGLIRQVTGFII